MASHGKNQVIAEPCPIAAAVDVMFNRWTTDVLWVLLHHGTKRFSELRDQVPGITPKVLAQRLRHLEQNGMIVRVAFSEMPPRVEYSATALARTLVPLFALLEAWSHEHGHEVAIARDAYMGPAPS